MGTWIDDLTPAQKKNINKLVEERGKKEKLKEDLSNAIRRMPNSNAESIEKRRLEFNRKLKKTA